MKSRTKEELKAIDDMLNAGYTATEISAVTGESRAYLDCRLQWLRSKKDKARAAQLDALQKLSTSLPNTPLAAALHVTGVVV